MENVTIYQIGLTMINGVGDILARQLLESLGDAEAVFAEKSRLLERIPGIGQMLSAEIRNPDVLRKAERELAFIEKNRITCYFLTDAHYPKRLLECPDAPVLFYFRGEANLDAQRIISLVGTRNATDYGRMLTDTFLKELAEVFPDTLVVSGLAYGIDVQAHRAALQAGLPTVAVLAHGLDRIYPSAHRNTAVEMLSHGGILTDFPSETNPDRQNFVKRNRIVAGLADATIVVQSAEKGGSLITADIASSYGRDVYAFPGRVGDTHSCGCNALIRQNKAGLITSATDFIASMCWDAAIGKKPPVQTQLLFEEDSLQGRIVGLLRAEKEMHVNQLAVGLDMPVYQLSPFLFELEMEDVVSVMPGNVYRLV